MSNMKSWVVTRDGEFLDMVFDEAKDADDVRKSLINHDGYDVNIKVRKAKANELAGSMKQSKNFTPQGHRKARKS